MEFEDKQVQNSSSAQPKMPPAPTPTSPEAELLDSEEAPLQMRKPKYKECLKNHAVNISGYAIDGCGEFMPAGENGSVESFTCAACNCHRNFHRKEIETFTLLPLTTLSPASSSEEGKRVRTKFTEEQKEKMKELAEKLGWRIQRPRDDTIVQQFCEENGVKRNVFKVWMHNNKQTLGGKVDTPLTEIAEEDKVFG